jgi:long-chain acyl-CoA synthetase
VYKAATSIANYLMHHELCPKVQTDDGVFRFMALYAKNRSEWTESDLGAMITGITVVTLYDTLGKESMEYILDQTHIKTIVLSSDKIKNVVDLKKEGKLTKLTHAIYFD